MTYSYCNQPNNKPPCGWRYESAQFAANAEYYRCLLDQIGDIIGEEAFTCDDGTVSQDVLRAKLPELVRDMKAKLDGPPSSE